ncbi:MAG: hypothetical protein GTN74_01975 [Proteobacteria bacterium]|nr:hypothetical protein [Pseudomonadota bacterium]NIS67893.1 hypothetical protein [Pseudomonadota bacterium]
MIKQNLQPSDVILIRIRERPAFYAQVRAIVPDVRKGWYRATLKSQFGEFQWILEDVHLFLGQTWTFQGIPYRIERIGRGRKRIRGKASVIPLKRIK